MSENGKVPLYRLEVSVGGIAKQLEDVVLKSIDKKIKKHPSLEQNK